MQLSTARRDTSVLICWPRRGFRCSAALCFAIARSRNCVASPRRIPALSGGGRAHRPHHRSSGHPAAVSRLCAGLAVREGLPWDEAGAGADYRPRPHSWHRRSRRFHPGGQGRGSCAVRGGSLDGVRPPARRFRRRQAAVRWKKERSVCGKSQPPRSKTRCGNSALTQICICPATSAGR